jgi:hypothetical protein
MTPRQHALLARQLIHACGDLQEAAKACRASDTSLSRFQTPGSGHFMPADVMADLEAYCGQPVYSRALVEARPATDEARDLVKEACEASESVTDLQREIRLAASDGVITPRERDRLARLHAQAEEQLRDVAAVIHGGGRT